MISAAALLLAALAAAPEALPPSSGFQLFPVRGVFMTDQVPGADSLIVEEFRPLLEARAAYFSDRFRSAFPNASATIDDANKRRTFAVSLQVARASMFTVPKPFINNEDVFLPITASLYFTNVMTGEVMFAATQTLIKPLRLPLGNNTARSPEVRSAFTANFESLIDSLIADAGKRFQPVVTSATVRKDWKGLGILDVGRKQGLRRGDTLLDAQGNEIRVISAGPTYAIASPELGRMAVGTRFERVSNQISQVERARVLPIVDDPTPPEFPSEALTQVFSDALGEKAPVALVPVNRTFAKVLAAVGAQVAISQEQLRQRELPNFFVRLRVLEPIDFEVPTNIKDATLRVVTAVALGELVDRSGRVLFAAHGRSRIQDEVISGMSFSIKDRREVAVKNALVDLATAFGTRLDLSSDSLPVVSGGDEIGLRDEHGMLAPGASWRTYRNIGRVDGIPDEVLVPTWDIEVTEIAPGTAKATLTMPVVAGAPKPEKGDVVFLDGVRSGTSASRRRFGPCGPATNSGKIEIPGYGFAALNVFAAEFRAPIYSTGLAVRAQALVRADTGFRSDIALKEPTFDLCVEAAYGLDLPVRCGGELCADTTKARFGYRVRQGGIAGEVKAKHGLTAEIRGTELRQEASPSARERNVQADFLQHSFPLNAGSAREFSKDSF